jgi:tetratricopeptide (TPR) repeat protein
MVRAIFLGCVMTLLVARAQANDIEDCMAQAPDRVERGCTAIIQQMGISDIQLSKVYTQRGRARYRMNKYEAAIADFNEAIHQNPKNPEALYWRGSIETKMAEVAKTKEGLTDAISDFSSAIKLDPRPQYLMDRGVAYSRNGDDASAIVDYTQAIEKAPRYALAYFDRAVSFAKIKNFSAALQDVMQVIAIEPQNEKAYLNEAFYLDSLGRFNEVLVAVNEAIRLNPADAAAYGERGRIFVFLNRLDQAIADDTKAIELHPTAVTYSNRGIAYVMKLMPREAIVDLTKAIEMDRSSGNSFHYRAVAHVMQNDLASARSDIDDAVNLRPQNAHTLFVRSIIRYAQHDEDGGKSDYELALRLDPKLKEVSPPETKPIQYFATWPFSSTAAAQKH